MGASLSEKILARTSGSQSVIPGSVIYVKPDKIMLYDWFGLDGLVREIKVSPEKFVFNFDHFFLPRTESEAKLHRNFRSTAQKYGINCFYDVGKGGIGFHVMAEKGHVKPGELIIHADAHVSSLGALGAYAVGVGGDVLSAVISDQVWLKVPNTIKVNIEGSFNPGVTSRDLFEKIMDSIGPDGGLDKVLEFTGPAIQEMSISSRMVLCNSVQYFSAQTAIIEPDDRVVNYLKRRSEKEIEIIYSDPDANYSEELHYNLNDLEPLVVTPPDVYYVKKVTDIEGIDVHQAFVGTCISGSLEDLRLAAKILEGKKVHPKVRFAIIPGTQEVYLNAIKEGLLEIFVNAGSIVSPPGCGPCFGAFGYLLPDENCICTGVLNTPGRMGSEDANIYLANPATVTASAVAGKITDPRNYLL